MMRASLLGLKFLKRPKWSSMDDDIKANSFRPARVAIAMFSQSNGVVTQTGKKGFPVAVACWALHLLFSVYV